MVWLIYKLFWNCEDCCLQSCVFSMHIRLLGFKPNKCYRVLFRACYWANQAIRKFYVCHCDSYCTFPCGDFATIFSNTQTCTWKMLHRKCKMGDSDLRQYLENSFFNEKINSKIWNSSQVIFHVLHSLDVFISIFKFGLYFGFHTHTAMHWWTTVVRRWHFTFPPFSTLAQDDKISLSNNLNNFCFWNIEFLVHTFKLSVGRV